MLAGKIKILICNFQIIDAKKHGIRRHFWKWWDFRNLERERTTVTKMVHFDPFCFGNFWLFRHPLTSILHQKSVFEQNEPFGKSMTHFGNQHLFGNQRDFWYQHLFWQSINFFKNDNYVTCFDELSVDNLRIMTTNLLLDKNCNYQLINKWRQTSKIMFFIAPGNNCTWRRWILFTAHWTWIWFITVFLIFFGHLFA